jgi:uncharacterized protein YndB with AHSA1/START domain
MTTHQQQLVIERSFNAPRELVWKAFTEKEHLKHWWGPVGFTLEVLKLDVRPGGVFHFGMKAADGSAMFGRFDYLEINAPERIVFTNAFADEKGNLIQAPFFSGEWPLKVLNTWTFSEKNGKTTILLRGEAIEATQAQIATFVNEFAGMNKGFGATFDQLEKYLSILLKV